MKVALHHGADYALRIAQIDFEQIDFERSARKRTGEGLPYAQGKPNNVSCMSNMLLHTAQTHYKTISHERRLTS